MLHVTLGEQSEKAGVRLLSHAEHLELSQRLIGREFVSHLHRMNMPHMDDAQTTLIEHQLSGEIEKLRTVPELDVVRAHDILRNVFSADGALRSIVTVESQVGQQLMLFSNPLDLEEMNRLFQICAELSETYLVVARIPKGIKTLHYCDSHDFSTEGESPRGNLRRKAGALPYSYRVGVPLSEMSQQYDFMMDAPDGYYFDSERVLEIDDTELTKPHFAVSRNWRPAKESESYDDDADYGLRNVAQAVTIWRAGGSRTRARIVISNGSMSNGGISLGFVVAERPPGSTARTAIAILFGLFASFVIYMWLLIGSPPESSVPNMSIMVTFLTVGASLSTEILPVSGFLAAPFMPRVLLGAHMVFGILFAIWILATGGDVGFAHLSGVGDRVGSVLGPLLLALSGACCAYLVRSWFHASKRYDVVTNPDKDFGAERRIEIRYLRVLRDTL